MCINCQTSPGHPRNFSLYGCPTSKGFYEDLSGAKLTKESTHLSLSSMKLAAFLMCLLWGGEEGAKIVLLFDKSSNNDLVARCLNVYILNIYLQTMNLVVKRGSFWVMNLYRSQIQCICICVNIS